MSADFFAIAADICGQTQDSILPTSQPPKHPVLDYWPFAAPKHRADAAVDGPSRAVGQAAS